MDQMHQDYRTPVAKEQLALSLELDSLPSSPTGATLSPREVWQTLAPSTQWHVRQTLLRILQEAVHDTHRR
jgi:hypothetical protein